MKPLPNQVTFSGLSPPWSLPSLDANFTNVWNAINDIGTYSNVLTDTGTTDAMVATTANGVTFSLSGNPFFYIIPANHNVGSAPTLNVNGTGVITITDAFGLPLFSDTMVAGAPYLMYYDGTRYRVLNPVWFLQNVVNKPGTTSRASTIVPANDPDLQMALPFGDTWGFEIMGAIYGSSTGAMGFSCNVNFSGSYTTTASFINEIWFYWSGGASAAQQIQSAPSTLVSAMNIGNAISTSSTNPSAFVLRGYITSTTAGTLGLSWAQSSSNSSNLNLLPTSYMRVFAL
jgi:hypothetical protein